jgi:hypothetical protein
MSRLAIDRHRLRDLRLGDTVRLQVTQQEVKLIRRGLTDVNGTRCDGLRHRTRIEPDGSLTVWVVDSVDIIDSRDWQVGRGRRMPGRQPEAVALACERLNKNCKVLRRSYRFRMVLRDGEPVVLKLRRNTTLTRLRQEQLRHVMRTVERLADGNSAVLYNIDMKDIRRAKYYLGKRGVRCVVRCISETTWDVRRVG